MMKTQKPKRIFNLIFLFVFVIFSLGFISAGNLSIFPNNIDLAGTNVAYEFNFSSTNDCDSSNIILDYSTTVTFNSQGVGFVSINISDLSSVPLALCEYRDGTLRKNHSFSDIIFNTIYAKNLNLSGDAIIQGKVNVTNNITAFWFKGNLNHSDIQNFPDKYLLNTGDTMTGNLTTSGNMTASFYFGDGQFLDGIQHGQLTLFLHNEASGVSGSKVLDTAANDTSIVTLSVGITADGQEFQNWTTDANVPGLPLVSDGIYEFHFHARVTSDGTKDTTLQAKIYKVNSSGENPVLLVTTEESTILTSSFVQENIHIFGSEVALDLTDRLLLRIIVRLSGGGANPTVELQIENGVESRLEVPSPSPTKELFIPYIGAVKNVNLGVWNITTSWFKGAFNWIIGPTSTNYLSFNGTQLDFDESQLNTTIDDRDSDTFVNANCASGQFVQNISGGTTLECATSAGSFNNTNLAYLNNSNTFTANNIFNKNLTVNGTTLFVNTNGRVGIGTASPSVKLDVRGAINATDWTNVSIAISQITDISNANVNSSNYWDNYDTPAGFLWISGFNATGDTRWLTSYTETDPLWAGNTSSVARIGDCSDGQVVMNTTTSGVECVTAGGGADSDWNVSGTNLFPYNLSYNVGIGTTSPNNSLHIQDLGDVDHLAFIIENNDSTAGLELESPGATASGEAILNLGVNTNRGINEIVNNSSGMWFRIDTRAGNKGFHWFYEENNTDNEIELMTLLSSGYVGIGTSSPDSAFHIKANIAGTVGSHPAGQLIIQNPADSVTSNVVITAYESDGNGNPDQQLWYLGSSSSSNSNIIFLNRRNALLQFGTNDNTQMTILGNGNVGIGTSTPVQKLDVRGDGNFSGEIYANNGTAISSLITANNDSLTDHISSDTILADSDIQALDYITPTVINFSYALISALTNLRIDLDNNRTEWITDNNTQATDIFNLDIKVDANNVSVTQHISDDTILTESDITCGSISSNDCSNTNELQDLSNLAALNGTGQFDNNMNFTNNITINDTACFGENCNAWIHYNGSSLIIKVN